MNIHYLTVLIDKNQNRTCAHLGLFQEKSRAVNFLTERIRKDLALYKLDKGDIEDDLQRFMFFEFGDTHYQIEEMKVKK